MAKTRLTYYIVPQDAALQRAYAAAPGEAARFFVATSIA